MNPIGKGIMSFFGRLKFVFVVLAAACILGWLTIPVAATIFFAWLIFEGGCVVIRIISSPMKWKL